MGLSAKNSFGEVRRTAEMLYEGCENPRANTPLPQQIYFELVPQAGETQHP
jgi:hypothetical protein